MSAVRNPRPPPIAAYCKPMRPDREEVPGRDDIARCAELAALDDLVNANIRQMAGPINQRDEE